MTRHTERRDIGLLGADWSDGGLGSTTGMYVFILQQDNTQNIKPEGQQLSEALTAARNKKCLEQILATTHNMTEVIHNKKPSLMNSGPERTT